MSSPESSLEHILTDINRLITTISARNFYYDKLHSIMINLVNMVF